MGEELDDPVVALKYELGKFTLNTPRHLAIVDVEPAPRVQSKSHYDLSTTHIRQH